MNWPLYHYIMTAFVWVSTIFWLNVYDVCYKYSRGFPGGLAPPRGAGRPRPPVHPGLWAAAAAAAVAAAAGWGELRLFFSRPAEFGGPGGALAASAGHHPDKLCGGGGWDGRGWGESSSQGPGHCPSPSSDWCLPPGLWPPSLTRAGPQCRSGIFSFWSHPPSGMQDLSSLTRDWTQAPCSGSMES